MQKHALEPLPWQALVEVKVAVLVVPRNRVPLACQMHADLVGPAGLDRHLKQRHGRQALQGPRRQVSTHFHQRDRAHAVRIVGRRNAHAPLAVREQVLVQGQVDHLVGGRPGALHQRKVGLACCALAKLVLQLVQR